MNNSVNYLTDKTDNYYIAHGSSPERKSGNKANKKIMKEETDNNQSKINNSNINKSCLGNNKSQLSNSPMTPNSPKSPREIRKIVSNDNIIKCFHSKNFKGKENSNLAESELLNFAEIDLLYPAKVPNNPRLLDLLVQRRRKFDQYLTENANKENLADYHRKYYYIKAPKSDKKPYFPIKNKNESRISGQNYEENYENEEIEHKIAKCNYY